MISSVDDYLFITGANVDATHPHGDMDRILINGGIMPLRTGTTETGIDRKKIVRGEDVCFVNESVADRLRLIGNGYSSRFFSRKLEEKTWTTASFRNAASEMSYIAGESISSTDILEDRIYDPNPIPSSAPTQYNPSYLFHKFSSRDVTCQYVDFNRGNQLKQISVENIFNDLEKFKTFSPSYLGGNSPYPYTETAGDLYQRSYNPGGDYAYSPPSSFDCFIDWDGGTVEDKFLEIPKHAWGGYGKKCPSFTIYLDMNFPADYTYTSLSTWVMYEFYFSDWRGGDSEVRNINAGFLKKYSGPTGMTRLTKTISSADVEYVMKRIAQQKGWDTSQELPDRVMAGYQVRITRVNACFVLSVAHTKWW